MANKNRTSRTSGGSRPGGAKPSTARGARPTAPREPARRPDDESDKPVDTSGAANWMVPAFLGLALVVTLFFFVRSRNRVPAEPGPGAPAVADSTDAGAPAARREPEPRQEPPRREPERRPAANPAAAQDYAIRPTHPEPQGPDPQNGQFTLAEATAGMPAGNTLVAEIETSMGTFTCDLWPDRAPNTVANFVGLARGTRDFWDPVAGRWTRRPYYDGSAFHRVIPDFMIQGGDILRSGTGGPGYEFADENVATHDEPGLLCMANHGPGTNGSQFFILEDPRPHLNGSYSVFGKCRPVDLVERIARVERTESDRPIQPVLIQHVRIRRGEPAR